MAPRARKSAKDAGSNPAKVEETTAVAIFSPTDAALEKLRQEYGGVTFDLETIEGAQSASKAAKLLKSLRGKVEKRRKEWKAPLLARGREIDAEAKRIIASIDEIEAPIVKALSHKAAEEARAALAESQRIDDALHAISSAPMKATYESHTVEQIDARLAELVDFDVTSFPMSRQESFDTALRVAIDGLKRVRENVVQRENDVRELAELRARARSEPPPESATRAAEAIVSNVQGDGVAPVAQVPPAGQLAQLAQAVQNIETSAADDPEPEALPPLKTGEVRCPNCNAAFIPF